MPEELNEEMLKQLHHILLEVNKNKILIKNFF